MSNGRPVNQLFTASAAAAWHSQDSCSFHASRYHLSNHSLWCYTRATHTHSHNVLHPTGAVITQQPPPFLVQQPSGNQPVKRVFSTRSQHGSVISDSAEYMQECLQALAPLVGCLFSSMATHTHHPSQIGKVDKAFQVVTCQSQHLTKSAEPYCRLNVC